MALGCGATFIARTVDVFQDHLEATIKRASAHQGTAFVEIYQNCNIFNDGAFKGFTEKDVRDERVLLLEHGKPLLFGPGKQKGIAFDAQFRPHVVTGADLGKAYVWDESAETPAPAMALATMSETEFPVPIGVFRRREKPTFDAGVHAQMTAAKAKKKESLRDLLYAGEIWDVK